MGKFEKKKRGLIWKVLFAVVLIFGVFVGFLTAYIWDKLARITYADEIPVLSTVAAATETTAEEEQTHPDETFVVDIGDMTKSETVPSIPESDVAQDREELNILLIGPDERTTRYNPHARADSMILVAINKKLNTVKLVSLERGIGVPILEGELAGQYDLLTHVFRWGGADLLVKTVEHCFKVDVKHYVRMNFAAVEKIVDAVGGIDIELSAAEADGINLWATEDMAKVKQGVNHVDGKVALSYARLRWIDSDWQRVGRQRKVILAVVEELKGSSLRQLNNLADTVLPLIQTNLSKLEIAELILYAPRFLTAEFDQMTIPKQGTYGGMSIRNGGGAFAVDYKINNDLLYRFLYEGVSSEELLSE